MCDVSMGMRIDAIRRLVLGFGRKLADGGGSHESMDNRAGYAKPTSNFQRHVRAMYYCHEVSSRGGLERWRGLERDMCPQRWLKLLYD